MAKRPRLRSKGDTPLIDPAVAALGLILPDETDVAGIDAANASDFKRNVSAVAAAAQIAAVPIFVLSGGLTKSAANEMFPTLPQHHLFTSEPLSSRWHSKPFSDVFDEANRSVLVLVGIWLEYNVLTTALQALTDGYDTYIALDAAPARSGAAATLSLQRLLQFGATPVLCSQVIHEWCIETLDTSRRAALADLLATFTA